MVLTDGDLDHIGDKIKESIEESWNKLEDHYDTFLTGFKEHIVELNNLAKTVK